MPAEDPRGLGLSELAYNFVGGLKANAKAYIAVTAPTVNSYKRLVRGRADERRDLGAGVRQLRLQQPDADAADPGAGSDRGPHRRRLMQPVPRRDRDARRRARRGRRGLDPGEPNSANLYTLSAEERAAQGIELLPANLLDATRELSSNDALRAGFGKTRDGDYIDYFVEVKRREVQAAHEQITQWELDRYLQLF